MSTPPLLNGPIPLYSNVPIEPQYYQPIRFQISNVTLGLTTIVTVVLTSFGPLSYLVGNQVRLLIPRGYGCTQLNNITGYVLSIPSSTQVEVDIYSALFNPFISASLPQVPQIISIGDINTGVINNTISSTNASTIPGAFINVSPL